MFNLLKSPTVWKFLIRHAATAVGGYFVAKGIVNNDQMLELQSAAVVALSAILSGWDKRDEIKDDITKAFYANTTPPPPPQGGGNLTRLPLMLLAGLMLLPGCAFKTHSVVTTTGPTGTNSVVEWSKERLWQGYAVTIVERGFGIDVGVSTANQTPKIKAGWFSSSVRYTPTSTNAINIPRMADSMVIGNSVNPFNLSIEEDFMSGDLKTTSNITNWTAEAISPK